MPKTALGVYRNGSIELSERPADVADETRVLVTFLAPGEIDLRSRGIDAAAAEDLRDRLAAFSEDWNSPEMVDYDDYDTSRRKLEAG